MDDDEFEDDYDYYNDYYDWDYDENHYEDDEELEDDSFYNQLLNPKPKVDEYSDDDDDIIETQESVVPGLANEISMDRIIFDKEII